MDDGVLKDFTGAEVRGHAPEWPTGASAGYVHVDEPVECYLADMKIKSYFDKARSSGDHSVICLYDRWGHIVKQWPDDCLPSPDDIRQAVNEELKKEGRRVG